VAARYGADDRFARPARPSPVTREVLRFRVPGERQLEFFGDGGYERLFREAVAWLEGLGGGGR